jgi:transposase-like protein
MTQHFLMSKKAKTLTLSQVMRLTDEEAETMFRKVRWPETDGAPICPKCGCLDAYDCRRPNGTARWECKGCTHDFSVTSGTLFANRKRPLRDYLAAIAIFCNEVKGKSALAMSRDLGMSYKAAFVLCHKLREAMAAEVKALRIGGDGKVAAVDGMYTGGYIKPANLKENRRDRRLARNQNGKRQVVVVARELDGRTIASAFKSEAGSLSFIRDKVAKGTVLNADEASSWNDLQAKYEMRRINHEEAYSLDGACTNMAESFFSRLRRAEVGHNHHIAGVYLARYAQESAWREDHRRVSNGEQVNAIATLALRRPPSVDFGGYWQRHVAN